MVYEYCVRFNKAVFVGVLDVGQLFKRHGLGIIRGLG